MQERAAECADKWIEEQWSGARRSREEDTQEALEVLEKWIEELRNAQNGGVRESVERQAKRGFNKVWARAIRALPSDKEVDLEEDGKRRFDFDQVSEHPPVLLGRIPRGMDDVQQLKEHGVVAVVSMSEDWEIGEQSWPKNMLQTCAMEWLRVPTPDYSAPTLIDLLIAVSYLLKFSLRATKCITEAAGGSGGRGSVCDAVDRQAVYVHCNRGRSRSGLVVICYLIARNRWTQSDALEYARASRKDITLGMWAHFCEQCMCA